MFKFERELSHFRWWRLSPLPLSIALITLMAVLMTIYLYNPSERIVARGEHRATVEKIEAFNDKKEVTLAMEATNGWKATRTFIVAEDLSVGDVVCYYSKDKESGYLC